MAFHINPARIQLTLIYSLASYVSWFFIEQFEGNIFSRD